MKNRQHLLAWISVSMLLLRSIALVAQCATPAAPWLHSAQTATSLTLNWGDMASIGQYQIRYWETSTPGDKTIIENFGPAPATLSGLKKNTQYALELGAQCGNLFTNWSQPVSYLTTNNQNSSCNLPTGVVVNATASSITVAWTSPGSHTIRYRLGGSGDWLIPSGALSIPASPFILTGLTTGVYEVGLKQNCVETSGNYLTTTIAIEAPTSCLRHKDFGKNLSAAEQSNIDIAFNTPSPFTFSDMIGVNDGGLMFRSFQNVSNNQITRLTTQYRNFHTIDEDFDSSIGDYNQNIKPRNTIPEGTPANTAYNKGFYQLYRHTHGFTQITGAIELLHYSPLSWKDKIYKENDWSVQGPAGIQASFQNYTLKYIDEFAPANGADSLRLVSNFQVGNEMWDYPFKADYHSLLMGARNAFVLKYGAKSGGGWRMKLAAGAFQAFRDNNCGTALRDISNCASSLERHDFIGDYLDVPDCNVLKDLDAIDCHPYSFLPRTTTWTNPENPQSEAWQIRNLAGWLQANRDSESGILENADLWSSEYGFDSDPVNGVGEKTQSAYLIRGLLMHSRYHFAKIFFYNAFDHARTTDDSYGSLYQSTGFWRLGTQPGNNIWPSPLPEHGASPKPSWYAMLDFKGQFGGHIFYKALLEDSDAYVWLLAKPDGSEPCLIFWSPQSTNDGNINQDLVIHKTVNWSDVLPENYKVASSTGQTFSNDDGPGLLFNAASDTACGSTTLTTIRRNPAFIYLIACPNCNNINQSGGIGGPVPGSGNSPFDPGYISSTAPASGGSGGNMEYQWQKSSDNINYTNIPNANALTYDPPVLTESMYFRRAAKRSTCSDFLYTAPVFLIVSGGCPVIASFQRRPNTTAGCNSGDFYYEVVLQNISADEQIILAGLPVNSLIYSSSTLNGIPFSTSAFFANLQYINNSSFRWVVKPVNGSTQTLRLYYCWANSYPNPVGITTAKALCSGLLTACVEGSDLDESVLHERSMMPTGTATGAFQFTVQPNPGTDRAILTYWGEPSKQANIQIVNATGQIVTRFQIDGLLQEQQWQIATDDLSSGMYWISMQIGTEIKYQVWGKM